MKILQNLTISGISTHF